MDLSYSNNSTFCSNDSTFLLNQHLSCLEQKTFLLFKFGHFCHHNMTAHMVVCTLLMGACTSHVVAPPFWPCFQLQHCCLINTVALPAMLHCSLTGTVASSTILHCGLTSTVTHNNSTLLPISTVAFTIIFSLLSY